MNNLSIETEDTFGSLLEFAANNDIEGFKKWIECAPSSIDEVGLWYIRLPGTKQLVLEERTPLMVAATYGSIDVLKLILSSSDADVNRACGNTKSTALHCAASGGSDNTLEVVKLLLAAGGDPNLADSNGRCPVDVIVVSPKSADLKLSLKQLLAGNGSVSGGNQAKCVPSSNSNNAVVPSSPRNDSPSSAFGSYSLRNAKFEEPTILCGSEKKEYPIDPTFPDIKNSIYGTDEFRMYSFKVRPCSRAYSHDWTECPFVHPGENARRRDPRKFHYSCVPCPDFRKGACRRGDMCEYAHGVFECWLHPAQYRTRLCKDGIDCARRVCFFAHTTEELRPLYVSTGSAVPSPHSNYSSAMDFAAAMNMLPGSPSSVPVMSPSPFTPPMSPSANGSPSQLSWPPNIPTLNLPGSNLQSSRLRSSINARDLQAEEFVMMGEADAQQYQLLKDLTSHYGANSLERPGRLKTPTPLNLEDLFAADNLSPRYVDSPFGSSVHSPTHKSALLHQFQQQKQGMISPINTNMSANNVDHHLLQGSYGAYSGRMSPRNVERLEPISPINSRVSMLANREKLRSLSFREPGTNAGALVGSPLSNWGSFSGKLDWALSSEELDKLRRSSSFDMRNSREDPDSVWAHSPILEPAPEIRERASASGLAIASLTEGMSSSSSNTNTLDHAALGAWLEQMQLDELMSTSK
uniref:C3H1-type domain-containing protein n=1 Tax=Kalanchoe fedtschenkoi TaxID=63787 RepID=A0A7N0V0B4_KALFE